MRFSERSFWTLPPRPVDNRVFGELMLSHPSVGGAVGFVPDNSAAAAGFTFATLVQPAPRFHTISNSMKLM